MLDMVRIQYMNMAPLERPVAMSLPIWMFLRSAFEAETAATLRSIMQEEGYVFSSATPVEGLFAAVIEEPGPFLLRMGILKRPELLRGAVISFEIEPGLSIDHVVKARTVEGLRAGDAVLVVYRLFDDREYAIPRDRLVRAIHEGGLVDFIEKVVEEGPSA